MLNWLVKPQCEVACGVRLGLKSRHSIRNEFPIPRMV